MVHTAHAQTYKIDRVVVHKLLNFTTHLKKNSTDAPKEKCVGTKVSIQWKMNLLFLFDRVINMNNNTQIRIPQSTVHSPSHFHSLFLGLDNRAPLHKLIVRYCFTLKAKRYLYSLNIIILLY